jgi:dienelactone hydrolase
MENCHAEAALGSRGTRLLKVVLTLPVLAMLLAAGGADPARSQAASDAIAERVNFPSADGRTTLVGYVSRPAVENGMRVPAVVMMHGRQGAYSTAAHGVYDATTLSQRHQFWGRFWAAQGYMAVLVDGFGPRRYPQGFGRHSYDTRPDELNEVTVRPLDAYGALAFLRSLPTVYPDRIGLQGWSNGGSATLAAMAPDAPGLPVNDPAQGFRAALAFYPACGLKDHFAATVIRPMRRCGFISVRPMKKCRPKDVAHSSRMPAAMWESISTTERRTISTIPGPGASKFLPMRRRVAMLLNGRGPSSRKNLALRRDASERRRADQRPDENVGLARFEMPLTSLLGLPAGRRRLPRKAPAANREPPVRAWLIKYAIGGDRGGERFGIGGLGHFE